MVTISHESYHGEIRNRMHAKHSSTGLSGQLAVASEEAPPMIPRAYYLKPGVNDEGPRMMSPHDAASHVYRCPKCRFSLFDSEDVAGDGAYGEASGQKSISGKNWNKGGMPSLDEDVVISSIFLAAETAEQLLDPAEAMANVDSGKLYCPKCKHKVGHYKWSGEQDNRGHFHCPSFNIPRSKVDMMPVRQAQAAPSPGLAPAAGAALPAGLGEAEEI